MGRKKGALYRPDYSSQVQGQERSRNHGTHHNIGDGRGGQQSEEQGVDSWRAYSNGNASLIPAANPYIDAPTQYMNPTASSDYTSNGNGDAVQPSHGEATAQLASHFTPYQPLRFSNGVQERQMIQGLAQQSHFQQHSRPPTQAIPLRLRQPPTVSFRRTSSSDHPVQSIEPCEVINPAGARSGLDVLRHRHQRTPRPTVSPPLAPRAAQTYLTQARLPVTRLGQAQPLLVILDLNGTLLIRPDRRQSHKFKTRPGVYQLLEYLFKHHVPMVYTSARPENAAKMVDNLLSEQQRKLLAAVWARDKLGLSREQYNEKVQVYKKLDQVWSDKQIRARHPKGGRWDQTNTILVDDSHIKALAQPHNLLQVPEFTIVGSKDETFAEKFNAEQEQILQSLVVKLEHLKWQTDVSRLIMRWQGGKEEIPEVPGSGVVVDEKVDQKKLVEADQQTYMPRPKSPSSDGGVDLTASSEGVDLQLDLHSDADTTIMRQPDAGSETTGKHHCESPIPHGTSDDVLGIESRTENGTRTPRSQSG